MFSSFFLFSLLFSQYLFLIFFILFYWSWFCDEHNISVVPVFVVSWISLSSFLLFSLYWCYFLIKRLIFSFFSTNSYFTVIGTGGEFSTHRGGFNSFDDMNDSYLFICMYFSVLCFVCLWINFVVYTFIL